MGNIFEGSEVITLGVQIEKNGRDFYRAVADCTDDIAVRKVFDYLAGEEEKHIGVFQELGRTVEDHTPRESYPGEELAYVRALAGEMVFTERDRGRSIAGSMKNMQDAVQYGIGIEKDSILLYTALKDVVHKDAHRVLQELVEEERTHLQKLVELKKNLPV